MSAFVAFGEAVAEKDRTALSSGRVEAVLAACASNRAFEVVELREWTSLETGPCTVVVVDCINDQVPTRNTVGVRSRERLALVLPVDISKQPQVRAMRLDFPVVMHLNHVPKGEPASLCLYFEPWSRTRREWTAETFLQRILFWLTETSKGTLHREGQPVEAMYFESPFDVVLPPDWEQNLDANREHVLVLVPVQRDDKRCTFRVMVMKRTAAQQRGIPQTVAIRVRVDEVVHGGVESFPGTLGELSDALEMRGSTLIGPLSDEIVRLVGTDGVAPVAGQQCLLLLSVPTKRSPDGVVERVDVRGFQLPCELWKLGADTGAVSEISSGGKHYAVPILGGGDAGTSKRMSWREIPACPVAVKESVTKRFARTASAVGEDGADKRRVLAGLGALGSALADLWTREGWGEWTLIDPDFVQPHNVVRHLARDPHIGLYKVDVVKCILDSTYPLPQSKATPFRGDVLTTSEARFVEDLKDAHLVVDATTTLEVPREISRRDDVPRTVSVFLTPSGCASVLLLEDARRDARVDELEAQYYGAILANDWGERHLAGHSGGVWVGAGCRDVSVVLSNELVLLHASILARQVRLLSGADRAELRVWISDEQTSAVRSVDVTVRTPIRTECGAWTIVSHEGLSEKLKKLRAARLPTETGGVLVGYVDHPLKRVFIVDALPAPTDSKEAATEFVRGVEGLAESLEGIRKRTAGIVGYIGEWHSHPPFNRSRPSGDDIGLLAHLARTLAVDGVPAVMIIVGAGGDISYSLAVRAVGFQ